MPETNMIRVLNSDFKELVKIQVAFKKKHGVSKPFAAIIHELVTVGKDKVKV